MAPPNRPVTDIARVETRPLEGIDGLGVPLAGPLAEGLSIPGLGLSPVTGMEGLIEAGNDTFLPNDPASTVDFSSAGFVSSPGIFRSPGDFMTGGNRTHNAAVYQLVTREAVRILEEERGVCVDEAEVRRFVHDELRHFKENGVGQHNGNVGHSNFAEILDHTVTHFGGRAERRAAPLVLESNEDVHWRIEEMIEAEFLNPENAEALNEMPADRLEILRSTLRTRLRAEFAGILMNEAYTEHLEDVSDFFRSSIVSTFEDRASSVVSGAMGEALVCSAADPVLDTRVVTDNFASAVPGPSVTRVVTDAVSVPAPDGPDLALRLQLETDIRRQIPSFNNSNFDPAVRSLAEWIIRSRNQNGEAVTFGTDGRATFPIESYVAQYEAALLRANPTSVNGIGSEVRVEAREEVRPELDVRRMAERGVP